MMTSWHILNTKNIGREVSDLLSTRPLPCYGFTASIVLFLIIVYIFFFRFKNHQQWWQQARASSAENVVEGEECNERVSRKSVEDPVVEEEKHTARTAKRRKVSLKGIWNLFPSQL